MKRLLESFTTEIIKLSSASGERHGQYGTDYATSALVGATATPAVALTANLVSRAVRNHMLAHRLGSSRLGRFLFSRLRERGPLLSALARGPARRRPLMTYDDLAGRAVAGALTGSGVQMLRDRVSKSETAGTAR